MYVCVAYYTLVTCMHVYDCVYMTVKMAECTPQ